MFLGRAPKGAPAELVERAQRKMAMIDQAAHLEDLRIPPSNRLEALRMIEPGNMSVRVNDQWRICFIWQDGDAYQVEFCDYH